MNTENYEQWFNFNKNLSQPLNEINKAITDIFKRSAQEHLEIYAETFARLTDQLKRLSTVKKPEDLLSLQKDCFNENMSSLIENSQRVTHIMFNNLNDLIKLFPNLRDPAAKVMEKVMEKSDRDRHANVNK